MPKTSSNRYFQNSKEWLDAAIKVAGTKHKGTYEAAYRISNHLLRFYRDSVLAACETQRIPVSKPMSATQFSSMMNASRVTGKGEQVNLSKGYGEINQVNNITDTYFRAIYEDNEGNITCKFGETCPTIQILTKLWPIVILKLPRRGAETWGFHESPSFPKSKR